MDASSLHLVVGQHATGRHRAGLLPAEHEGQCMPLMLHQLALQQALNCRQAFRPMLRLQIILVWPTDCCWWRYETQAGFQTNAQALNHPSVAQRQLLVVTTVVQRSGALRQCLRHTCWEAA